MITQTNAIYACLILYLYAAITIAVVLTVNDDDEERWVVWGSSILVGLVWFAYIPVVLVAITRHALKVAKTGQVEKPKPKTKTEVEKLVAKLARDGAMWRAGVGAAFLEVYPIIREDLKEAAEDSVLVRQKRAFDILLAVGDGETAKEDMEVEIKKLILDEAVKEARATTKADDQEEKK